jgi:hypothetical protein
MIAAQQASVSPSTPRLTKGQAIELQRRRAYELFDKGEDVPNAHGAICGDWPKSQQPCLVSVRNWHRAWERTCKKKGYVHKKNSHPSWVYELTFETYCTYSQEASVIFRKLKKDIPNQRPSLYTIYGWIRKWQAMNKLPSLSQDITAPVKKSPKLKIARKRDLVCRRPGLPYIFEEICVAWQRTWRVSKKKDARAEISLRPCRGCEGWVDDLTLGNNG